MVRMRIVGGIFLISVINHITGGGYENASYSELNVFTNLKNLAEVGDQILDMVSEFDKEIYITQTSRKTGNTVIDMIFKKDESDADQQLRKHHNEVMTILSQVSNQIIDASHTIFQSFDIAVKRIGHKMKIISDFTLLSHDLSEIFESINGHYKNSVQLQTYNGTGQNVITLRDFVQNLFLGSENIKLLLEKVYSIMFKSTSGFVALNYLQAYKKYYQGNDEDRCDIYSSPHQRLYYIYSTLIKIELKGLVAITHGYELRSILNDNSTFQTELAIIRESFKRRTGDYRNAVRILLQSIDREIHRCDAPKPIRKVTYAELEGFSSYLIENEVKLNGPKCKGDCEHHHSELHYLQRFKSFAKMDGSASHISMDTIEVCHSPVGSSRNYEWIKISGQDYYGRYVDCDSSRKKSLVWHKYGYYLGLYLDFTTAYRRCDFCGYFYYATGRKINVLAQSSDIANNMIVTGVKFVMVGNTMTIQIRQGELLGDGAVKDSHEWKKLNSTGIDDNTNFDIDHKILYLDNVIVAPNYVVTGIRFEMNNDKNGYKIVVQGTEYNFATGNLNTNNTMWFDPEDAQRYADGYDGSRREILLNDLDNPIYAKFNKPDHGTNKFVKFTHTSLKKDAGQSTIPFLDIQPVTMAPAMPLNGIGLFYKAAKGFGGYVALRIFTDSVDKYLN